MNPSCQKVWDALERGEPMDAGLRVHAATCPTCQATTHLFQQRPTVPDARLPRVRPELAARALAELQANPTARSWWTGAACVFVLELFCAFGAVVALAHGHSIGNVSSAMRLLTLLASLIAATGLATFVALSPAPGLRRLPWPLAVSMGLLVVLGGSGFDPGGSFLRGALVCGACELGTALLPFAVMLFLLTRFSATAGRAFAGGFAAAGAGMIALHLHCPNGLPTHLLIGHVFPALGAGLLAWSLSAALPSRSFAP